MKQLLKYLRDYFTTINLMVVLVVTIFTALLVFCNYHFGIEEKISRQDFPVKLCCWFLVFIVAFGFPYLVSSYFAPGKKYPLHFYILFLAAAILAAFKLSLSFAFHLTSDDSLNNFWNHIFYWPVLLLVIGGATMLVWKAVEPETKGWPGFTTRRINLRPYILLVLFMLPLVALAATRPDFQTMYPKLHSVSGSGQWLWWQKGLYELSYGSDFITIEFFFRGFLILAFMKYAGKYAILPMACFYCTIHFGKPMGECISSYFGGMILGIIVYNTRSVVGGLIVHLGVAWMMEGFGYL